MHVEIGKGVAVKTASCLKNLQGKITKYFLFTRAVCSGDEIDMGEDWSQNSCLINIFPVTNHRTLFSTSARSLGAEMSIEEDWGQNSCLINIFPVTKHRAFLPLPKVRY